MAELSDNDRDQVHREFECEAFSKPRNPTALTRQQLRAAINAADTWVDENSASFNAALPSAVRSALSAKEKAQLLMFVIRRRYEVT